ncbi:desmoplakin [Hemileuca sp. nucleopolyhedrovirus]|uniref:Desmoplakin n=1 Tax=Hemileuca sp. nucleopolyhedrovirus TaxID=1367203 RepID=S5N995_9ABAC|nr:desmoplakin [Hemileuca sp. nucleopolyhedrovirus]AGR56817.1 desmoplakin [Hemileuca sp. nucleopolyhedrovirus]
MSRYKNIQPKYMNTEVNSNTVKNLLQTINSISKQCKIQNTTDDTIERIRSIIYLYRPHLKLRYDLQLPELVTEALMPTGGGIGVPNQITHNFNYKYDYNTNIRPTPTTVDQFGVPVFPSTPFHPPPPPPHHVYATQTQPPVSVSNLSSSSMPQEQSTGAAALQPVQQNYYINPINNSTIPTTATTFTTTTVSNERQQPPPPPSPPGAAAVATTFTSSRNQLIGFNDYDIATIDDALKEANGSPSNVSYHRLIRTLIRVTRKYIETSIFFISLEKIDTFEQLAKNDLHALINCINRDASLSLNTNSPQLCRVIVTIIQGYYRFVKTILKSEEFTFVNVKSIEEIENQTFVTIREFKNIETTMAELRTRSSELEIINNRLQESCNVSDLNCADAMQRFRNLQTVYDDLKNNYDKVLATNRELVNANETIERTIRTFGSMVSPFDGSVLRYINSLHRHIESLNARLVENANYTTPNAIATVNDNNIRQMVDPTAEQRIRDLERKNRSLDERLALAQITIRDGNDVVVERLRQFLTNIHVPIERLSSSPRDMIQIMMNEYNELKSKLDETVGKLNGISDEHVKTVRDLSETTAQRDRLTLQVESLRNEVERQQAAVSKSEKTVATLQRQNDSYERNEATTRNRIDSLDKQILDLRKENERLTQQRIVAVLPNQRPRKRPLPETQNTLATGLESSYVSDNNPSSTTNDVDETRISSRIEELESENARLRRELRENSAGATSPKRIKRSSPFEDNDKYQLPGGNVDENMTEALLKTNESLKTTLASYTNKDKYIAQLQDDINEVKNNLSRVISSSSVTGSDFLVLTDIINREKLREYDQLKQRVSALSDISEEKIIAQGKKLTQDLLTRLEQLNETASSLENDNLEIKQTLTDYRRDYESLSRTSAQSVITSSNETTNVLVSSD